MDHAWVNITYMTQADYDAWAAQHNVSMPKE